MKIKNVSGNLTFLMGDNITLFDDIRNVENIPPAISFDGILGLLVTQGKAHISLNGHFVDLNEGDFQLCYPKIVIADTLTSLDFQMRGVYIAPQIIPQLTQQLHYSWKLRTAFEDSYIFHFDKADCDAFTQIYDFLKAKACDSTLPNRDEVLATLFKGVSMEFIARLDRYFTEDTEEVAPSDSPASKLLFNRFTELLDSTSQKLHPISWWASQLNITPKYLSFICRSIVGKPASAIIQEAIIREANSLLQMPDLSIKQIADSLGFSNQSHFGTYYKRYTGKSPIAKR